MISDNETGERFCDKCGFVIRETLQSSGPEWRSFAKEGGTDPTRTGAPTSLTMHDRGLSTVISQSNRDATGKPLSTSMKSTIERLRTWDSRSKVTSSADKNLRQALGQLSVLKDKLSLSDSVNEKASYIYRKALENGLVKGRSISALIAASIYAACRDTETPRTLKDVADAGNIKKKDISRCYRILHYELELKMPVVNPIQCIARISSKLRITEKSKRYAIKVLQVAQEHEESAGKDPMGIAAAALYLACVKNNEYVTQRDVAEASNVTEVTIRNRYKGLRLDQDTELQVK
ncbi:transcription factor TFIIB cyclin-related protein [Candidatus Nitrosopumilus koreensis AR1]|uniref:Transcription initiation factor IIB n=1 Tax=Candidatus Nitrosopumilus koreensis AR1 TaxID=1229908 RepID=K0B5D3_9ARCH|nr:transcription factor TFIIB cyclin-related protein [Candidatus Nitrosopumilus koreensis]AFS81363.1 transcription factor TFIIB cyclin-related protein [Candidatus Nitrosopumilus koreensis AR1]